MATSPPLSTRNRRSTLPGLTQLSEERLHVLRQRLRLLHRGEMAAAGEDSPAAQIHERLLGDRAWRAHHFLREGGVADRGRRRPLDRHRPTPPLAEIIGIERRANRAGEPVETQRAAQGLYGALSVGFITPAEYSFLPRLVRTFRQQYPGVTLQLREAMTDTQIEELKRGALDVGLLYGTVDGPGFSCQVIWSEPLVAAIPRKHALAVRAAPISVKRLAGEELVMFPREIAPALFDEILGFCRSGGFSPRITQEARQTQTIISLVSAGLGIAITPASIRDLERKGVVYRTFRERTPIVQVSAVWSNDRPSQAVLNFVAMAQSTAATLLVSARR